MSPTCFVPLNQITAGTTVQFLEFRGSSVLQQRLIGLGLVPGVLLTILQNRKAQGILISLNNNKIAIGSSLSRQIMVS